MDLNVLKEFGFGVFAGVGIFLLFKLLLEKTLVIMQDLLNSNRELTATVREISAENRKAVMELTEEIKKISKRNS